MKISEKIWMNQAGLKEYGPITIVALGDSVTHGALNGEIDYETAYWNVLRKKILAIRDYVPVNVINAGIGGTSAIDAVKRLDRQVLTHQPDLIIICFGLNDVNGSKEEYLTSLEELFVRCQKSDIDTIFLTPNMLNTYVAEDTAPEHLDYAKITAAYQNSGKMDDYILSAISLAKKLRVPVCDAYGAWKEMSKTEDITKLLSNRINHPTREMHALFADMLFDMIFDGEIRKENVDNNTMYRG